MSIHWCGGSWCDQSHTNDDRCVSTAWEHWEFECLCKVGNLGQELVIGVKDCCNGSCICVVVVCPHICLLSQASLDACKVVACKFGDRSRRRGSDEACISQTTTCGWAGVEVGFLRVAGMDPC